MPREVGSEKIAPDIAGRESSFPEKEGPAHGPPVPSLPLRNPYSESDLTPSAQDNTDTAREGKREREREQTVSARSYVHLCEESSWKRAATSLGRQTRGAKRTRRVLRVALPLLTRVCVRACARARSAWIPPARRGGSTLAILLLAANRFADHGRVLLAARRRTPSKYVRSLAPKRERSRRRAAPVTPRARASELSSHEAQRLGDTRRVDPMLDHEVASFARFRGRGITNSTLALLFPGFLFPGGTTWPGSVSRYTPCERSAGRNRRCVPNSRAAAHPDFSPEI